MAIPFQDAILDKLAATTIRPIVGRGSLITFNYLFHKPGHDPQPLVMVTDVLPQYVRGINLHYLTFPVIKNLIYPAPGRSVCDSPEFTYEYIKKQSYIIRKAFRQYKRNGVDSLRKLNCDFIVTAMSITRSFDPNEIEAIRRSVREQIRRMANVQAGASPETPI